MCREVDGPSGYAEKMLPGNAAGCLMARCRCSCTGGADVDGRGGVPVPLLCLASGFCAT